MANAQQTIGIVGGGQLGRMLTLAALPMGFNVLVIDPADNCPAAQVGAEQITAGYYAAAIEELGRRSDFVTIEIEHIDTSALTKIAGLGIPVNPAPETIKLIQDKFGQKQFLAEQGLPVGEFRAITDLNSAVEAMQAYGGAMILKTRHGAYDGRGNAVVRNQAELEEAMQRFEGIALYAEKLVSFVKELAVMVARDSDGNIATYPVVETIHERNICQEVYAPAQVAKGLHKSATAVAREVAGYLVGAGVYGIELFLTDEDEILINEIAPRVHNSGHYTMDACFTSQFEQHIRAITGLPLGDTSLFTPAAAMINILGERNGETEVTGLDKALAQPQTKIHLYGKAPTKIDRKMGHINSCGETLAVAQERARAARKNMEI